MSIKQSSGGPSFHGSKVVGTTAVQMVAADTTMDLIKGVLVKADSTNTDPVYVGSQNVTADGDESNSGFPLAAGESIFIPTESINLWVISSAVTQKVFWIAR
jgi:hypothetical protein